MTDIVDRLRAHDLDLCPVWKDEADKTMWMDEADRLIAEAADEILHLRNNQIKEPEVQLTVNQFSLRNTIAIHVVLLIIFVVFLVSGYTAFAIFFCMWTGIFASKIDNYFNIQKLFEEKREHSDI